MLNENKISEKMQCLINSGFFGFLKEDKTPYTPEELENLKQLMLSGDPDNIEIVFAILEEFPGILNQLIHKTFGNLLSLAKIEPSKEGVAELVNLKGLYLSDNKLQELPDSFGNLVNLKVLSLNDNKLQKLPDSIGNLVNLKELYLSENNLQKLPDSIGNLVNLKELDLKENPISSEEKNRIRQLLPNCDIYF